MTGVHRLGFNPGDHELTGFETAGFADRFEEADLRDKLTAAVRAASVNADSEPVIPRSPYPKRRISFEEYLGRAREAWRPDITVTPAWIREVTGCSRGLSSRLAAALTAEVEQR